MGRFDDRVVLVTGASSGIGRATAQEFARAGARLVLAARGRRGLEDARGECERLGAVAVVVPVDVGDEDDVRALVERAVAEFGRIDVVVGCAGVAVASTFEDLPGDAFRRVVDTNLYGHVHLLRAVLPHLRAQGGGTYVAVGSIEGRLSAPYQSAYVASKHALLGLVDSVRDELVGTGIDLVSVLPSTVDTPIYRTSANRTGRAWHPMPPVVSARSVARTILRRVEHPRRTVYAGRAQALLVPVERLAPGFAHALTRFAVGRIALRGHAESGDGNLFAPDEPRAAVDGGVLRTVRRVAGAAALTGAAVLLATRRRR